MKSPARFLRGFVVLAIAGLGLVVACSNQGEGDRCELDNNDSDCDTGADLICVPGPSRESSETGNWRASYPQGVNDPYRNADRCCPRNRDLATHPACVRQSAATDAAPPADSGPVGTDAPATTDAAATDAATGSDAAQDAADAADGN